MRQVKRKMGEKNPDEIHIVMGFEMALRPGVAGGRDSTAIADGGDGHGAIDRRRMMSNSIDLGNDLRIVNSKSATGSIILDGGPSRHIGHHRRVIPICGIEGRTGRLDRWIIITTLAPKTGGAACG
jgi:hypothetical protein